MSVHSQPMAPVTVVLPTSLDDAPSVIGQEFIGEWITIDEDRTDAFDHAAYVVENVVEMDGDRYPDGLIEGFHLVSLVERLHRGVVTDPSGRLNENVLAIDKVRFVSPMRTGERMRTRGVVAWAEASGQGIQVELDATIEVENRSKPGFVIRWRQSWSAEPATIRTEPDTEAPPGGDQDRGVLEVTAGLEEFATTVGRRFKGAWMTVDSVHRDAFAFAASAVGDAGRRNDDAPLSNLHLLSLLDHLVNPVVHPNHEPWFGWNYGLDDVLFVDAVYPGERLRVQGTVGAVEPRGEGQLVRMRCTLEIAGRPQPAVVCQWLTLWLPKDD